MGTPVLAPACGGREPRLSAELGGAGLARVAGRSWAAVVEQLLAHYGAVARCRSTRAA